MNGTTTMPVPARVVEADLAPSGVNRPLSVVKVTLMPSGEGFPAELINVAVTVVELVPSAMSASSPVASVMPPISTMATPDGGGAVVEGGGVSPPFPPPPPAFSHPVKIASPYQA
jgi:hypothetical protein